MKLKCKKTYLHRVPGRIGMKPRIKEGEYYQVLDKYTKPNGERYWHFLISDEINPRGSGWFVIDEFFETPEEVRDKILNEILNER